MGNVTKKGTFCKIVLGVIVVITLVVLGAATSVVIKASEGSPMPEFVHKDTSKALGSNDNPYTILEIVPDNDSAMVGYLINGQEPYNLLSIGATDKDNPESAISIYENAFASENSKESKVNDYVDAYTFNQDKEAIGTEPASHFNEKKDEYKSESEPGTDMAYSEFGYYTKVTDGTGKYNYNASKKCFEPADSGSFTWTSVGEFKYVGTGNIPEGSIPCTRALDYGTDGQRGFSYNNSTHTGAVGENAYKYYYSPTGGFVWAPNNNYNNENIFIENQTEISYVENDVVKTRPITGAVTGDKLYMTRTENIYFLYKASTITVNDLLLSELVGNGTTGLSYKTQVVSVTPSQLVVDDSNSSEADKAKEIIDSADMIIIHDNATGYRIARAMDGGTGDVPKFSARANGSKDLTTKTANYIIARGAKGYTTDFFGNVTSKPAAIIFDEEAIKSANSYASSADNCPNLKLVYDIYNNLGAKLAYNWMSGQPYTAKLSAASTQTGYRNFTFEEKDALGKSQFVYNFTGEDDSWLTNAFADSSKIVKSELNKSAFDNVTAGQTMSVATMISAINKEANGYNQPRKLRILEIEPNEKYIYDPNNRDSWIKYYVDLFPWFIGTNPDIKEDLEITTMPTYEFIGKNEDVNENYDLILVGCKEQDETNGVDGYNDEGLNVEWFGQTKGLAYTAVGDLITTFGGDEVKDAAIEDRTTNVEEDWANDYTWNYGLFSGNVWYNAWNAPHHGFENSEDMVYRDGWRIWTKHWTTYRFGFQAKMISQIVGGGDAVGIGGQKWWYYKNAKNHNFVYGTKHGSDANMIGLRYAGNDLTKKKYDQLVDFSTQAPLVVDDKLYWDEGSIWRDYANEISIDRSSFVYKLANKNVEDSTTVYKHARGIDYNGKLNNIKENLISYNCSATFTNTTSNKAPLPAEYNENEAINYNQQTNSSGNNVLEYHFTLNGSSDSVYGVNVYTDSNGNGIFEGCINHEKEREINQDNSSYDSERAANLIIFDETNKSQVYDGSLYANHTYLVTRILPDSELGMVPWKLEIFNKNNPSVRFAEVGYTRIKPRDSSQIKEIKVLQMNLTPDMMSEGSNSINFANHYWYTVDKEWWGNSTLNAKMLTEGNKTSFQKQMSKLLNVDDFKIQVDFMDNQYWKARFGNNKDEWEKALMEYDMLVIGFQDVANFTNDEVYISGFEKFRESGKAIILSHDLCQDASIGIQSKSDNWDTSSIIQADARYYLRDISGQIRKYYDAASYNDKVGGNDYSYFEYYSNGNKLTFEPSDNFKIYTSIYEEFNSDHNRDEFRQKEDDVANTPIYNKYTYTLGMFDDWHYTVDWDQSDQNGIWVTTPIYAIREYYSTHEHKPAGLIMDNSLRAMLYYSGIKYDYKNNRYMDKIDRKVGLNRDSLTWNTNTFATYKVQAVNEGQITKYPYAIPDILDVAQTHVQNYQLDLEYDSDGDVLVWYNLASNGNNSIYKGRNQDSRNNYYIYTKGNVTYTGLGHSGSMTETEQKLFVNTMVAAYRAGASEPYITVTNPDVVNNGDSSTLYLEDKEFGIDSSVFYRINDDTTNSKILGTDSENSGEDDVSKKRTYKVTIYKNDSNEPLEVKENAIRSTEYQIPVSFSEVKTNGIVKYRIVLESTYVNESGVPINTINARTVNVCIMPMFGLR